GGSRVAQRGGGNFGRRPGIQLGGGCPSRSTAQTGAPALRRGTPTAPSATDQGSGDPAERRGRGRRMEATRRRTSASPRLLWIFASCKLIWASASRKLPPCASGSPHSFGELKPRRSLRPTITASPRLRLRGLW